MLPAPKPLNEDLRLKDLYSFDILDTENEGDFDDLVELVSQVCGCPIASITFIDKDRQWFKAEKNMGSKGGSRTESFCGHAILEKEVFVVNDARKDNRFFDNPHVTGGLKIGFYAGAPIVSSSGHTLGTVCAIDNSPHSLTSPQLQSLQSIANQVSRLLDLRIKNRQILQKAEQLINAEKKIAQLNISQREEENYQTAYLLHEDIAQTTAAVKMYMNFAKDSKDLSAQFLDYGIEEIDNLHKSITRLSRSLAPTTLELDSYACFIEDMVVDYDKQHNAIATFSCSDDKNLLNGHFGLMVYRVVQDLLRLATCCRSKNISISIETVEELHISFSYDEQRTVPPDERNLLESNISNRVEMLQGKMWKEEHADRSFIGLIAPLQVNKQIPAL